MTRGATLIELTVVLLLVGLLAGIATVAVVSLSSRTEPERGKAIRQARAAAIRSGKAVRLQDQDGVIRFLPDGRAIGQGIHPLTGELVDAQQ